MNGYEAPQFFRLAVYGQQWGSIEEVGTKVFENKDNLFSKGTIYADLLFSYVADKDLQKMEEALIKRGFAHFDIDSVDKEKQARIPYVCCDKYWNRVKQYFSKEEGLDFLNKKLPTLENSFDDYLNRK